ncbi:MAG: alpha/beta fold hydrolase [Deltaproteobacteria bacterium]|nr:alpha/beta fold hydrolase [Deltaproteobacteria bacterium]
MTFSAPHISGLSLIARSVMSVALVLLTFSACSTELPSIKDYDFDHAGYRTTLPRTYSQYATWEHGKLHYVTAGRGSKVILIHGLGGSWDNWKIIIPIISARHRVYALDLPGFGLSDRPEVSYSIPFMTQAVLAFMEKAGVEKADFVGHSMGGHVLMDLALKHPEKIQRMILLDAVGAQSLWEPLRRLTLLGLGLLEQNPEWLSPGWVKQLVETCFYKPNDESEEMVKFFMAALQRPEGQQLVRSFSNAAQGILNYPLAHRLRQIRVKTLVVWGQNDRVVSLDHAVTLNREISGSQLRLIPRSGHIPQLERPERLARIMLEYFAKPDGAASISKFKTPDYP